MKLRDEWWTMQMGAALFHRFFWNWSGCMTGLVMSLITFALFNPPTELALWTGAWFIVIEVLGIIFFYIIMRGKSMAPIVPENDSEK